MTRDSRIWSVPTTTLPPVRTNPAVANLAGKTAAPRTHVMSFCEHCGEKIRMNKGTDYWFHVRTQVEECGP